MPRFTHQQYVCQQRKMFCVSDDDDDDDDSHRSKIKFDSLFLPFQLCSYYKCVNGEPKLKKCEDGLHYNAATQGCDSPSVARCPIVSNKKEHFNDIEIECPSEGVHFYPHPLNCHLYHICHNGVLTKMMCGRKLYYDIDNKRCELASRARCIVDALKDRKAFAQSKGNDTISAVTPSME